jgi:Ca2+/Na+ antiporter
MILTLNRATEATPSITEHASHQRFWWALLVTLFVVFIIWGIFQPYPFNLILWAIGLFFLVLFLILIYRSARAPAKIELAEIRRLIVCDKCGVETEGPYEAGDHVFREIGPCPRCDGRLYIKAIYSIDKKKPLKRQQPPKEVIVEKDVGEDAG